MEDKIDNALAMLSSLLDKLNQLAEVIQSSSSQQGQAAHKKSVKSGSKSEFKSPCLKISRLWTTRQARWYRNPYILCAVGIYLLYFALSIFSWTQWHHYRDENVRLRLVVDKYRVNSIILREICPQAAITLSAYEHITDSDSANTAIEVFRENINAVNSKSK